jgi:hypothetical protein
MPEEPAKPFTRRRGRSPRAWRRTSASSARRSSARARAGDQLPQHHRDDGHDDHHPRLFAQELEHVERIDPTVGRPDDAESVLTTEASQEGLAVLISKSHIVVDDSVVCPVPADATHGIEGKYKRSGPNDLYIVPLANALQSWRERDRQIRAATGKDPCASEAIIIADSNTPYRLLVEVLFTLGQTEFAKFHLMVLQGQKK